MSKVLIVDDEKSIRITLSEILKNEGYETDSASDAEIALKVLEYQPYDIIVTDIIMPRLSGIDLIAKVREKWDNVQIIIMTGEPTVETAVKAVRLGANDYLTKPISKDDLLRVIRHAEQTKIMNDAKISFLEKHRLPSESLLPGAGEYQNTIQGITSLLFSLVEARDPYTASHQRRVGNLSAAIAQKMNFNEKEVQQLRIIGYIHDIGKIMIPLEILSKPGALNPLELQLIRNHPLTGYEMLTKIDLPELISKVIYQHHERCDGSGYPRCLKADEITMESKIIIVADVVEAMMSHRPYRPALGLDAALREICENSGSLYDADVVQSCIELFHDDHYVIDDSEYINAMPT